MPYDKNIPLRKKSESIEHPPGIHANARVRQKLVQCQHWAGIFQYGKTSTVNAISYCKKMILDA
jgi:hypothetical protein